MKTILLLSLLFPSIVWANCPNEFQKDQKAYCLEVIWLEGQKKIDGQWQDTDQSSPFLIPMKQVPQKWIYSQAEIAVWEKGDQSKAPVLWMDFRVFPYMFMDHGHHHSTHYKFSYDTNNSIYTLSEVGFQKMHGCWTLRWTTNNKDDFKSSRHLAHVVEFANLPDQQIEKIKSHCMK